MFGVSENVFLTVKNILINISGGRNHNRFILLEHTIPYVGLLWTSLSTFTAPFSTPLGRRGSGVQAKKASVLLSSVSVSLHLRLGLVLSSKTSVTRMILHCYLDRQHN
jgi:hypothetical protein